MNQQTAMFYTVTCYLKFDEATAILAGDAIIPLALKSWQTIFVSLKSQTNAGWHLLAQAITLLERLENTQGEILSSSAISIQSPVRRSSQWVVYWLVARNKDLSDELMPSGKSVLTLT